MVLIELTVQFLQNTTVCQVLSGKGWGKGDFTLPHGDTEAVLGRAHRFNHTPAAARPLEGLGLLLPSWKSMGTPRQEHSSLLPVPPLLNEPLMDLDAMLPGTLKS